MSSTITRERDTTLVITRLLEAPPERVFEAWTRPEHIAHWWGPKDFTVPFIEMDAHRGGRYRACIRSPEGEDYWIRGEFLEVEKPGKLVFSWAWDDDNGEPGHWTEITLSFVARGEKTLMSFRQEVFESVEARDSHEGGWSECFDRLERFINTSK